MIIKRIEVLENKKVIKPEVLLPAAESVIEAVIEPVGVDKIINHIEHETRIDLEPYTKHKEYGDINQWNIYTGTYT
jgi:hypothetical protein